MTLFAELRVVVGVKETSCRAVLFHHRAGFFFDDVLINLKAFFAV